MRMTPDLLETIEQSIELPLAETDAPLYLACQEIRRAWAEIERLRVVCAEQNHEIGQKLGRALGYPRFADDPVNWPDAAAENSPDVCVGEHVAETLAVEAVAEIQRLREQVGKLRKWSIGVRRQRQRRWRKKSA